MAQRPLIGAALHGVEDGMAVALADLVDVGGYRTDRLVDMDHIGGETRAAIEGVRTREVLARLDGRPGIRPLARVALLDVQLGVRRLEIIADGPIVVGVALAGALLHAILVL